MPLTSPFILAIIIPILLMLVSTIFSKKSFSDREKSSPFESGFDPKSSARLPFSLRFFLIAIIFLIFDVEISLLLPLGTLFNLGHPSSMFLFSMTFLLIVTLGLIYEWKEGSLQWID